MKSSQVECSPRRRAVLTARASTVAVMVALGSAAVVQAMGPAPAKGVGFPTGFRWCVATSAHQVEGGNTESDWWDFEQEPGRIRNGDRSGQACDHWNRLESDTKLLQDLHVSEYRFSVEWAKLEPREGEWDLEAVAHYRRELELLEQAGIEPMVTLHHFTLPRWVRERGGWEWAGAPEAFARYAAFVMENVGPRVRDWITVNEPMVHLVDGYMSGIHSPGLKGGMPAVVPPMLGLLRAHALAYHRMHELAEAPGHVPIRIGLANHLRVFDPPSQWHVLDAFLAGKFDQAFNWAFPEALESGRLRLSVPFTLDVDQRVPGLEHTQDFVGVNYYSRDIVQLELGGAGFKLSVKEGAPTTDLGWEIYPEGFYRVLKAAAERFPGKAIFVTENGIADSSDARRAAFLRDHLAELARAIADGVPVEGYCHWSLMDNFEWNEGFAPRFGLYEVDYGTLERKPRPSAILFGEIASKNGF